MSDALQFLMFKNTLQDLGYNHKARITAGKRHEKTDVTTLGNTVFRFISYFTVYDNKESYLWYRYVDMHQKMPVADYKYTLDEFAQAMIMEEKTRIGEIGWEVKYRIYPGEFDVRARGSIMLEHARRLRQYIKEGFGGITPAEGDLLTSYPYGPSVNMQLGLNAWIIGKEERTQFVKLFGLGDLKKNGWNYGRYDSNIKVKPI